jgi:hypothetical protein
MEKQGHSSRRSARRWASVAGAVAVVAAVLAAISGPTSSAAATRPAPPTGYVAAGVLRLSTGAADRVVWQSEPSAQQPSGTTLGTQNLGDLRCLLTSNGPDTLLSFSAGTKPPGLVKDSIGVFGGSAADPTGSTSRGVPCSRVEAASGEALTLELAGKVDEELVHRADLDVEVKAGAKIVATLFRGTTAAGRFELRSGSSIVAGQGSTTPGSPIFNCSARSDSGPDSGALDNCRFLFDGLFDKVTLTAAVGAFSLEGGADSTTLAPSTFYLAEKAPTGTVTCPSDEGPGLPSDLVPQEGADYSVTGYRSEDADGRAVCTPIDYDLTFDGSTLHFTKRGPLNPNATFVFNTTFSPEPTGTSGGTFGLAPTRHVFDNDPTHTVFDLLGCRGTPQYDGDGNFTGIANILTSPGFDLVPATPGVQYACVFDEAAHLVGPGSVQLTQGVFLIGDWSKFR